MPKVTINTYKSHGEPGSIECHYGYTCTVGHEGQLVADVPEELLQNELDNGRVTLVKEEKTKAPAITDEFTNKTKDELKAYLDEHKAEYHHSLGEAKLQELCRKVAAEKKAE